MKNIHVLPTDKPSRLSILNSGKLNFGAEAMSSSNSKLQHIYITSDEEIQEGDWMIRGNEQPTLVTPNFFWDFGVRYYKIILTTDQDLIKDGVQAIDDEFIKWFVENPSCEFVEVVKYDGYLHFKYMVIIPQEEPKQETLDFISKELDIERKRVHKQETLEEAARRYTESTPDNDPVRIFSFIEGAKSEEARDYWFEQFKNKGGDK
jgi:hypothetical protein